MPYTATDSGRIPEVSRAFGRGSMSLGSTAGSVQNLIPYGMLVA